MTMRPSYCLQYYLIDDIYFLQESKKTNTEYTFQSIQSSWLIPYPKEFRFTTAIFKQLIILVLEYCYRPSVKIKCTA